MFSPNRVCKYFGSDSSVDAAYEIYWLMKYIKASRIGRRIFRSYKNLYDRGPDRMATDLSVNFEIIKNSSPFFS